MLVLYGAFLEEFNKKHSPPSFGWRAIQIELGGGFALNLNIPESASQRKRTGDGRLGSKLLCVAIWNRALVSQEMDVNTEFCGGPCITVAEVIS